MGLKFSVLLTLIATGDVIISWYILQVDGSSAEIIHSCLERTQCISKLKMGNPHGLQNIFADNIQTRVVIQVFKIQATVVPKIKNLWSMW